MAIIGAGPAGVTLAAQLRPLSHLSVELFEASGEVGGQSQTYIVDDVKVELGTAYLTAGYRIVRDLAAEVGCPAEVLPKATMLDDAGREVEHPSPDPGLMVKFVAEWWRWHRSGQMELPSDAANHQRFDAWLRERGLGDLVESFSFAAGLTAQLYGPIPAVSAHNALTWMRPSLFYTGELGRTAHIPAGFETLWRRLTERSQAKIHLNTTIKGLQRGPSGWTLDAPVDQGPFDHVFIACPLDALESPLSAPLRDRFGPFEASRVYSAVWRARSWPKFAASRCYLPACSTNARGRLLTIRRNGGDGTRSVGQLCAYAERGLSLEGHRQRMIDDAARIVGLQEIEIKIDRLWRYNIRYSPTQLKADLPRFIAEAQGDKGVWYTGGLLSHWNVDSITDFNHELVQAFAKRIGAPLRERRELWRLDEPLRDL